MKDDWSSRFGPFCLDPTGARLLKGENVVPLPPKALAALIYLMENRNRLVGKEELLDAVWDHRFVSQGVLKNTIATLRQALDDDPKTPSYIETAHRLGYRFIADVKSGDVQVTTPALKTPIQALSYPSGFVGRQEPLAKLERLLEKALAGEPQLAFVTGEPGIGKTALIDAFVQSAANRALTGRGQCVEQYGQGEPYLPVLEALNELVKRDEPRLTALLRQVAPTWLAQLPWYLNETDQPLLQQALAGATQMRMLREFGEFLGRCSTERPLLLVLEDLHWSDHATLDLLAYLARRKQPASWLILGSYRPEDVMLAGHELKHVLRELQIQGLCTTLPLELLSEASVSEYLAHRFPDRDRTSVWLQALRHRSGGLPFFLVQLIETVEVGHDGVADMMNSALPAGVQQLLERQFERLTDEHRRALEAASVVGMNFSAETVAAALSVGHAQVEECCESLARLRLFISGSESLDHYRFRHAFYREFAYNRLPPLQSARLHLRVGEWLESARTRPEETAAELALHFERGRDYDRAVRYLLQAAQIASQRHAMHEAVGALRRALSVLDDLSETPERLRLKAESYVALAGALQASEGYAVDELATIYGRALELLRQIGDVVRWSALLWGLSMFHLFRADFDQAIRLGEALRAEAKGIGFEPGELLGHITLGIALLYRGELAESLQHLRKAQQLYVTADHGELAAIYSPNPGIAIDLQLANLFWLTGYPDAARVTVEEALVGAEKLAEPYTSAASLAVAAWIFHYLRDEDRVLTCARIGEETSARFGFPLIKGWASAWRGRAQGSIALLEDAVTNLENQDSYLTYPTHLALLAEVQAGQGQAEAALVTLCRALDIVARYGERIYEAELHRLQGELLLKTGFGHPREPEACFQQALAIARRQGAKSWELRAATSLARLWRSQGRLDDAKNLLNEIYGWFTEGFDTPDLRDAKALLNAIGSQQNSLPAFEAS